jgi:uncharacterized protein (DUF58 family)
MIPAYAQAFSYQIPWKSNSIHYGGHRGTQRGLGFEFKGHMSLLDYPDARRVDLRQTLRDPYEEVQVRLFNQDNTTPIFAVCDVSSSMQFKGHIRKLDLAKEVAASVAYSAHEMGDVFSFIAYNQHVLEDLTTELSHHLHQSFEVIEQLTQYQKMRVGAEGILQVAEYLTQQKGLLFWISDFHMPLAMIEQALNAMSAHQVVPVVLWDEAEHNRLPKFGFGNMLDPETGASRSLFFRASLRAEFAAAFAARKEALDKMFERFDSPAIYLNEQFEPERMSHYFEQMMG